MSYYKKSKNQNRLYYLIRWIKEFANIDTDKKMIELLHGGTIKKPLNSDRIQKLIKSLIDEFGYKLHSMAGGLSAASVIALAKGLHNIETGEDIIEESMCEAYKVRILDSASRAGGSSVGLLMDAIKKGKKQPTSCVGLAEGIIIDDTTGMERIDVPTKYNYYKHENGSIYRNKGVHIIEVKSWLHHGRQRIRLIFTGKKNYKLYYVDEL